MSLAQFLPVLLAVHIVLAISLLVPSLLLPFTMRSRSGAADPPPGRFSRGMYRLQRNGTLVIAAGLALTGICLVAALGTQLFSQAWLLLALGLYAANLLLAFFVQRPGSRVCFGSEARPLIPHASDGPTGRGGSATSAT